MGPSSHDGSCRVFYPSFADDRVLVQRIQKSLCFCGSLARPKCLWFQMLRRWRKSPFLFALQKLLHEKIPRLKLR
jgi:hypothetical protein